MSKSMIYPLCLAALLAYLFVVFVGHTSAVQESGVVLFRWLWVPSLELDFSFQLDGLSLLFSLLITGIGALIFFYAAGYMRNYQRQPYFFTILFLFALSMLGLVLADHLMVLFIFWELTTITSYLLIGFNNHSHIARRNALQALLVTGGAGLVLFAGLVWMGIAGGSFYLSDILKHPDLVLSNTIYADWIFGLIFIGCIAKSAQMPYHFWLPNAMAAPTPVSAYLHSATMVKAGIYLLARLQPVFGELELWMPLLGTLGAVTAVWASILSITQNDLKQLLAYTTLMALGTLTFLLAFPSEAMAIAAMVFLVVHALYKAALFLMVGMIDQTAGTRQLDELSGLKHRIKHIWYMALLSGLSMAGIPLFFGFIAKELQYAAALEQSALAIGVLMTANALMIVAAYMVVVKPFWGEKSAAATAIKEKPSVLLWLPCALLGLLGVMYGIAPMLAYDGLIHLAVNDVVGSAVSNAPLSLWHGFNAALLLSIITFGLGGAAIIKFDKIHSYCLNLSRKMPAIEPLYFKKLDYFKHLSVWITNLLHDGSLEHYLRIVVGFVFATILLVVIDHYTLASLLPTLPQSPNWIGVALSVLAIAGAFYAIRSTTKIMALAALGASGFAMAGIFLLHGALDVAMTQLLVETLFVILAAAILWRIPEMSLATKCHRDAYVINAVIAIIAGAAITCVMMVVLQQPLDLSLTYFFEHTSYTQAHGRNIVNVILVDFRAFDTFGEATVVAAAALGLWSLTRNVKGDRA